MKRKRLILVGALTVAGIVASVGLYSSPSAEMHPTNCRVDCPDYITVNDNNGGVYICQHMRTCTNRYIGQSCDYEPISQCNHIPNPFR